MSKTIEERVVEMRFDNEQFESNAKTSMNTVEDLKKSLDFSKETQGFDKINGAIRNVDMSTLGSGVETVRASFSALQVMGITALARITNSAITAGRKIEKALVGPLVNGGITRALNIEQAKFQLEGLGVAWEKVSGDIDYAVKGTAYGMDVAAKACSQLIASNIQAGDSMKTALRGISGVAAMTNSSYEDISNVFTRVAGQGRVMAVDLLSLSSRGINAAATLAKHLNKSEAQVRDMVSKGKIDFATFAEAMDSAFGEHAKDANKTFTGALSNMKAALSRIGADIALPGLSNLRDVFNAIREVIDDAHKSLKPVIDSINKIQNGVSKLFVSFVELKGLNSILGGITNLFKGIWSVLSPIKDAFVEIFPPKTAEQLAGIAKGFEKLTSHFKLTNEQGEKVKETFSGIFTILKAVTTVIKNFAKSLVNFANPLKKVTDGLLSVASAVTTFAGSMAKSFAEFNLLEKITSALSAAVTGLYNAFKFVGSKIVSIASDLNKAIGDAFGGNHLAAGFSLAAVVILVRDAYIKLDSMIAKAKRWKSIFGGTFGTIEKLASSLDALKSCLWNINRDIKYDQLMKVAKAVALLAVSIVAISMVDSKKLGASFGVMTAMFADLMAAMTLFDKLIQTGGYKDMVKAVVYIGVMNGMATAILMLAGSLAMLSRLNWKELAVGLTGVTVLMGSVVATSALLSRVKGTLAKGASNLILFSFAVKVLASACKELSSLNGAELGKGLTAVSVLLAEMLIFTRTMKGVGKGTMSAAMSLIAVSAALKIIVSACKDLGSIDPTQLGTAIFSVAILLGELSLFSQSMKGMTDLFSVGASLILLATGIDILAKAVVRIGQLDPKALGVGLSGFATALTAVTIAMKKMPDKSIAAGLSMIAIAEAILVISKAVNSMSGMSLGELGIGLAGLAGSLGILVLALNNMKTTFGGAAALLVVSSSLIVLGTAMKIFASMEWGEILKSLLSLSGMFLTIGAASVILQGAIVPIIALSGAVALLSVSIAAIGAGFMMFGAGVASVAAGISTLVALGSASVTIMADAFEAILTKLIGLGPKIAESLADSFLAFTKIIGSQAPIIGESITSLVLGITNKIREHLPTFISTVNEAIISVLQSIREKIPELIKAGSELILSFLHSITPYIKDVVSAGIEVVLKFIEGVSQKIPDVIQAAFDLIINFLNGLATAIRDNSEILGVAIANVVTALLEGAIGIIFGFGTRFVEGGTDSILKFISGIKSMFSAVKNSAVKVIQTLLDGIKNRATALFNAGKNAIQGFINGVKNGAKAIGKLGSSIGNTLLNSTRKSLDEHSPSKEMHKIGEYAIEGLIEGVDEKRTDLAKTTEAAITDGVLVPTQEVVDETIESLDYGAGAIAAFTKAFQKVDKEIGDNSVVISATDVIKEYAKQVYEQSQQYKTDTKNLESYHKKLEKLVLKEAELTKQINGQTKAYEKQKEVASKRVTKKTTTFDKKQIEEAKKYVKSVDKLKKELESTQKAISDTKEKIKTAEDDMVTHTKEVFEQLRTSLSDTVKGAIDPLKTSLDTGINLFSEFDIGEEFEEGVLLKNMKSQLSGVRKWKEELSELAERGLANGLIEKLKEMGPTSAKYVKAFVHMTNTELKAANRAFEETTKMSADSLIENFSKSIEETKKWVEDIKTLATIGLDQGLIEALGKMGTSGGQYVNAFLAMSADDISKFNEQYAEYLKLPDDAADSLIASFAYAGSNAAKEFAKALIVGRDNEEVTTNSIATGEAVATGVETGVTNKETELTKESTNVAKGVYEGLGKYLSRPKGESLGGDICNGIIAGLENGSNAVTEMARQVARDAYKAAKKELDINSPSKKFEWLGECSDKGLALGIGKYAKHVVSAAADLGKDAVSGLKSSIHRISDILEGYIDYEPTIRPVVDLSNVESGAKRIGGLFGTKQGFRLANTNDIAYEAAGSMRNTNTQVTQQPIEKQGAVFKFEQNNYSPTALSRLDIYRQTKNQFAAMKGVLDNV